MGLQYQKSLLCQQILHEELLKIIEGADPAEVERSIVILPYTFTVHQLKENLARYYILYDGFEAHLEQLLAQFQIRESTPLNQGLMNQTPKLTPISDSNTGDTEQLENNQDSPFPISDNAIKVTGTLLSGKTYEQIQKRFVDKLSEIDKIDAVNFKMDYEVDVYANEIDDTLMEKLEKLRREIAPNIPEFKVTLNVKKDRRGGKDNRE